MFKRFQNWLRALVNLFLNTVEDPEMMIDLAINDMRQQIAHNRELGIKSLKQVKILEYDVAENKKQIEFINSQVEKLVLAGEKEKATEFLLQKKSLEEQLLVQQESLEEARQTTELARKAIKAFESEVRKEVAKAKTQKAIYASSQVQNEIAKAVSDLDTELSNSSLGNAYQKIKEKRAEASARMEMVNSNLSSKLSSSTMDIEQSEAEAEYEKLRSQLMGSSKVEEPQQVSQNLTG